MPVFDFTNAPAERAAAECTYESFRTNESHPDAAHPILLLDNHGRTFRHHSCGVFTNPAKRTSFEFQEENGTFSADILRIDARFTGLLKWLGESYQCPPVGRKPVRGLRRLQDPRDRLRRRHQAVGGGWFFTVYDRASAGQRCAGGGSR